ncbi:flagellar biosynthesis protein FlgL [Yoonia sp. R2331]|uniref:flagellar biosynthesis protein FlgL n=1 Tax=Yoonia sp. R2331 TaxID=3237238 RepID=UPI0034E39EC7
MPVTSLGDMSQNFQSLRQTGQIKSRIQTLSQELSTGQRADLTSHMRGDTTELAALDRELTVLSGFDQITQELARSLARSQMQLAAIDQTRNALAAQLITLNDDTLAPEVDKAVSRARTDFSAVVNLLNGRDGDRSLFAGRAVDSDALADAEAMLADIVTAIGGATDAASIEAAITTWFDDPAGGFATMGYLGDTGAAMSRKISATETLSLDARADDVGVKELLKGVAMAAIADVLSPTLATKDQSRLARSGADTLFAASTPFVQLQSRIGENEERISLAQTTHSAQRTSFTLARNDIALADPFETATLLQDMQRQLELQFATTARMSQLSLVNYL